jgi:hypothetical protein
MGLKRIERLQSQGRLLRSGLVSAPQGVWFERCAQQQTSLTSQRAAARDCRLDIILPTFITPNDAFQRTADQ